MRSRRTSVSPTLRVSKASCGNMRAWSTSSSRLSDKRRRHAVLAEKADSLVRARQQSRNFRIGSTRSLATQMPPCCCSMKTVTSEQASLSCRRMCMFCQPGVYCLVLRGKVCFRRRKISGRRSRQQAKVRRQSTQTYPARLTPGKLYGDPGLMLLPHVGIKTRDYFHYSGLNGKMLSARSLRTNNSV